MHIRVIALLALSATTTGCTSYLNIVKQRASFDLTCPPDQVQVSEIGGTSYGAVGCGARASYTCSGGFQTNTWEGAKCQKEP